MSIGDISKEKLELNKKERTSLEGYSNQGCSMKIVEYNRVDDIIVEFQDKYKGRIHSNYHAFLKGQVKNPYFPAVCGVGKVGIKYPSKVNGEKVNEYKAWTLMIHRCFDEKTKEKHPTYRDVTCCDEWLLYENFYEWLHEQENFEKWNTGKQWNIDKDIFIKGNKIYSPNNCCLVPNNVNMLFVKNDAQRGIFPIGVRQTKFGYMALCRNPYTDKQECLGTYSTSNYAFLAYKNRKEEIIKQVAEEEYAKGNITKRCFEAMVNYEVEITD